MSIGATAIRNHSSSPDTNRARRCCDSSGRCRRTEVCVVGAVLAWGRCPTARQWHRHMRVEFLGIPRERAGISELEVQADTLGQLLIALEHRFPSFGGLIESGRL